MKMELHSSGALPENLRRNPRRMLRRGEILKRQELATSPNLQLGLVEFAEP